MKYWARVLNRVVRTYLRYSPINKGKRTLLRLTKKFILPEEEIVTILTRHGFLLRLNLRNHTHRHLYFYSDHDESYEINNLKRILRPGDVCWDIGANIGFYTCLFASLVGKSGHVVGFEPVATTFETLRFNIELNGFDNVILVRKAVGAVCGIKTIYYNDADIWDGGASLKATGCYNSGEEVEVITLDDVSLGLPTPDFIKIDVEGYQREVFEGGRRFFATHGPMIMAELRDSDRDAMYTLQNYLHSIGYVLYEFDKHSLRICENILNSCKHNFFMVKKDSAYRRRIDTLLR